MNWSVLPDLSAVALLTCAFASMARRNPTSVSGPWLTGWVMVAIHFAALSFRNAPGPWGNLAVTLAVAALTWTGVLFMWASVPYRKESSSRLIMAALLAANTFYIVVLSLAGDSWMLKPAAALFGLLPLTIALKSLRSFKHRLRWILVAMYLGLSVFLLVFQGQPGNGGDLAVNGVLFTVFFGCTVHFWYMYRRNTAGAFITIAGFSAWACVFLFDPLMRNFFPGAHIESEVWNLPKFVVAVGMILLLLEDQIEHNKYLALHDDLTGLANRRLFQDRLASALERARRTDTQAGLLVIDLDRFKQVNDTLGHHVGDLLLQRVATIFSTRMRRSDTVARTGGDEFSVILEEPTSREEALHVGQLLIELLAEPIQLGQHMVRIGASVGIAVFPHDAPDLETLCIQADLRMYDAKRSTESRIEPLPPGTEVSREDCELQGQAT